VKRALIGLAWAAMLASVPSAAPGQAADGGPGVVEKVRLPSGLTIVVRENPTAPVVAVSLFVRVGSRWEAAEQAGITNLLQHSIVKGAGTRSALEIAEEVEGIGGSIGASADMDFSEIRGTALARHWRRLLGLVADVALCPSIPADGLEPERRSVLTAIRSRRDQPFPRAFDTMMERLYGPHPYGRPSIGRAEVVERLDRAALLAHWQRYYRAGRMIVSVSGHVQTRPVIAEVARLFARAPAGDGEPEATQPAPRPSLDRTVIVHQAAQAQVLIGFLAPPVEHPDYAAVKVLSIALGGGMASRLFTEVRDKQGLAYVAGASYPTRRGPGYFLAQAGTAPANAARAEESMKRELERLRREGLTAPEIERAKTYLLGQFALDRRTNARLAWYAAFFEALGVGYDFALRYVRAVEGVTASDVARVASAYLASPTIVSLGSAP
jgi:predicted Zn-dependent peptidase